ncbi:MAG: ComF family protein, partial [Methylotenera sp.]|nr:ComF family protein [Oligoflexia bacterium]
MFSASGLRMSHSLLHVGVAALFRCIHCDASASLQDFPFCSHCLGRLIRCPPLCRECGGLHGHPDLECDRPWAQPPRELRIKSHQSAFLLMAESSAILKTWKKHSSWAVERKVFKMSPLLLKSLRAHDITCVVPVPQTYSRSFELGGSPAEKIAGWASRELGVPMRSLLEKSPEVTSTSRQAELGMQERLVNPLGFRLRSEAHAESELPPRTRVDRPGSRHERILLVDDFLTTGKTLRAAAEALLGMNPREIHLFTLGMRPLKIYSVSELESGLTSPDVSGVEPSPLEVS